MDAIRRELYGWLQEHEQRVITDDGFWRDLMEGASVSFDEARANYYEYLNDTKQNGPHTSWWWDH